MIGANAAMGGKRRFGALAGRGGTRIGGLFILGNGMFSHVMLGAEDIAAAKRFYDAALGVFGVAEGVVDEWGRLAYMTERGRFVLSRPIDGQPATSANGGTIGFLAGSTDEVDAWHAAGLANGGTAIEDPPGARHVTGGRIVYLAYLRDPTGNKICAAFRLNP